MVYKIRVVLDTNENIFRDIEIKDLQNLWNLHIGIKSAFNLQSEDLSVFNLIEEDGIIRKTIPLEDMSDEGDGEIMSDVYINEAFGKVKDKIHFQYGMFDLWEFFCELVEISDEKPGLKYPISSFRFGNVPLKAPSKSSENAKNNNMGLSDDFNFDDDFNELEFENEEKYNVDEDTDYFNDIFEEPYDDNDEK